jgi:hypothetical protein
MQDTASSSGSVPTAINHSGSVIPRGQGTPMFRQQTAQGIAQEFAGFPGQAKPKGAQSVKQTTSPAQRPQRSSKSLPGDADHTMAGDFSAFPGNHTAQKNADWDPARLTSFMTAAASLHEGELKILNSISTLQDFEAELAQLSGGNAISSQHSQPAVQGPTGFNSQVLYSSSASDIRTGIEKMNAIRHASLSSQSPFVSAGSGPGASAPTGFRSGDSAPSNSGNGGSATAATKSETNRFRCTGELNCPKTFARQCELK